MKRANPRSSSKIKKLLDKSWPELIRDHHAVLNMYLSVQHSQMELIKQLQQKIQSSGGYLDQMYSYLDPKSALDWLDVTTHAQYANFWDEKFPIGWAARIINTQLKAMNFENPKFLEVVGLACGDGREECQLVEALLEVMPRIEGFPFYLFDINPLLLEYAYKHAKNLFRDEPKVAPMSILGNMYELNLYHDVFFTKQHQSLPRVVLLLGATIGNLTDEVGFLQHSLGSFASGTLLLLDYTLGFAPVDQVAEIMEKDPYFSKTVPTKWVKAFERFDLGPMRRYKEGNVKKITSRPALEVHRARIPGSYHIEIYADVTLEDGEIQSFGINRIKRYDSESFIDAVEATGWQAISGHRFGTNREMYLFCKK